LTKDLIELYQFKFTSAISIYIESNFTFWLFYCD